MRIVYLTFQREESADFVPPIPISRGNLSLEQCENLTREYQKAITILSKQIEAINFLIHDIKFTQDRPDDDEAFTKRILELENRLEELHIDLERNTRSLKELTKNSV